VTPIKDFLPMPRTIPTYPILYPSFTSLICLAISTQPVPIKH
jgi:hypothetical protein